MANICLYRLARSVSRKDQNTGKLTENAYRCDPIISLPGGVNRPSSIDRQADSGHEIVIDEMQHGQRNVRRASLVLDQRAVDRGLPLRAPEDRRAA